VHHLRLVTRLKRPLQGVQNIGKAWHTG
jgi:hypothetical protein